jgi:serine phosphatase RsbU (regulator of sigma subunit)/tetratricopeptide (TPR) repeat protein
MRDFIKYFFYCLLVCFGYLNILTIKGQSLQKVYDECQEIMISNPDSAFNIIKNVLDTSKLTIDDHIYPYLLMQLGDYHRKSGNYDTSYVKYFVALNEFEKRKNTNLIAEAEINIGILYDLQRDPKSAIKKYNQALKNYLIVRDTNGIVKAYMNLGISYKNIGLSSSDDVILDSAYINYFKAEEFLNKTNYQLGLAKLYINIGNLKYTQQFFVKAIFYYKKALKIAEENEYNRELALALDNLGWAYQELNDNQIALKYALDGLKVGRKIKSKYNVVNSLSNISQIYQKMGDYKTSNEYLTQLISVNDSLITENTLNLQNKLQSKYESEKKDSEIALLNAEKEKDAAIALAEQKKKNIIIFSIAIGLIIVIVFSLFLYKRFKITHRQKQIIEEQKQIVDQKNTDITDSIFYAKRIQSALLKEENHISKNLPSHFIFFQPKDIVSGDFYWTTQKQDFLYVAAADCTGHGVPGALLTMLGTAFLNEITAQEKTLSPAEILEELRTKFIAELGQTGKQGESRDGMDISLIRLNLNTKELQWAGANNSLYMIQQADNSELIEIKANKQPIGYFYRMSPFNNHTFQLEENDLLYLFSDGFADQFGGEKGKKFMYKPFKKLLIAISSSRIDKQKGTLKDTFNNWKGDLDQIDDVCVIGVRV